MKMLVRALDIYAIRGRLLTSNTATVTALHVSLFGCIMTEVFVLAKKTVVVRSIAGVETCVTVPGQGIGVVFDLVWLSVKAFPRVTKDR